MFLATFAESPKPSSEVSCELDLIPGDLGLFRRAGLSQGRKENGGGGRVGSGEGGLGFGGGGVGA